MINTKEIHSLAKAAGACDRIEDILDSSPEKLVDIYKSTIDFCLEKNFPSVEYLEQNIGRRFLSENGVFVNADTLLANLDFIVALGSSVLRIGVDQWNVSRIYLKHSSIVTLAAENNAIVSIDCLDNSQLTINAFGHAQVSVSVYGDAQVTANDFDSAVIKIDRKNKVSY